MQGMLPVIGTQGTAFVSRPFACWCFKYWLLGLQKFSAKDTFPLCPG